MRNFSEPAEALNSTIRECAALCDPSFSQLSVWWRRKSDAKAPWSCAACSSRVEMYMHCMSTVLITRANAHFGSALCCSKLFQSSVCVWVHRQKKAVLLSKRGQSTPLLSWQVDTQKRTIILLAWTYSAYTFPVILLTESFYFRRNDKNMWVHFWHSNMSHPSS